MLLFSFSRGAYLALLAFILVLDAGLIAYRVFSLKKVLLFNCVAFCLLFVMVLPVIRSVYTAASLLQTVSQTRKELTIANPFMEGGVKAG
jgi:hypothetical protein